MGGYGNVVYDYDAVGNRIGGGDDNLVFDENGNVETDGTLAYEYGPGAPIGLFARNLFAPEPNLFSYAGNNPVAYTDPTGLDYWTKKVPCGVPEKIICITLCRAQGKRCRSCAKTVKVEEILGKLKTSVLPRSLSCDCVDSDDLERDPCPVKDKFAVNEDEFTGYARSAIAAGAAMGAGYGIYRGVRMIPSLVPPLWPTIPANLAIP